MRKGLFVFFLCAMMLPIAAKADKLAPGGEIFQPESDSLILNVKAAHNNEKIFWKFEWLAETPAFYHDAVVRRDGKWHRVGRSPWGYEPDFMYEDRLTFLVDKGGVRGFQNNGCYITCHDGQRFMEDVASKEDSMKIIGKDDMRKYILESRNGSQWWDAPLAAVKSKEEIMTLRENGIFLDFPHWRAHRSNPAGYADDQYVLEYRNPDSGKGPFYTNWDDELNQPIYMFDPEVMGYVALDWEVLQNREFKQDEFKYAMIEGKNIVPFDPDYDWQEGDTIPRRILRVPEGSRGSTPAKGLYNEATMMWTLEMERLLDTQSPLDDHALVKGLTYNMGFAVHKNATTGRYHYVTHTKTVGIGVPADIVVHEFEGSTPDWDSIENSELYMFYPGQVTWEWLASEEHPGFTAVRKDNRSCSSCHGDSKEAAEKLTQASMAHEVGAFGRKTSSVMVIMLILAIVFGGTVFVVKQSKRN